MSETVERKMKYETGEETVIFRSAQRPKNPEEMIQAANQRSTAKRGICPPPDPKTYEVEPGIVCDQDVAVKMRDGATVYADIYRPDCTEKVPVILAWSFYGKRPLAYGGEWNVRGVKPDTISKYTKFESPDPLYWCHEGYAIANADDRGSGYSDGDHEYWGTQDGRDGYDFIEWIAKQPWCNGKVSMSGTSALAMAQWYIAAQCPPHLACIAPWEGTSDMYREWTREGGILHAEFTEWIISGLTGKGYMDDMTAMATKNLLLTPYWQDKIPDFKKITIPCYTTGCWSHIHLRGSVEGYKRISSQKKWIRVHNEFEWPDYYRNENLTDLKRFFDRYLKGIHNGWEMTPYVRLEVQDQGNVPYIKYREENEFPLARTIYKKLYLNAEDASMSPALPEQSTSVSYDANQGQIVFDYSFEEQTELTGYMKLHLWVEARGHNDMDIFITVSKLSSDGKELPIEVLERQHPGAWGKLKVSHRKLDPELSTDYQPVHAHTCEEKLNAGEIVPVDVEIWPTSIIWHKGQKIRVRVAGRYIRGEWYEPTSSITDNAGEHVIYTGGSYDSYLQVPMIPPRVNDGGYILN